MVANMELVFPLLVVVLIVIMLIPWSSKKQSLGTIRCNRCHHVGLAKGIWQPFKGIRPVCQKCDSEDWQTYSVPNQSVPIRVEHGYVPQENTIKTTCPSCG